MRVDTSFQSYNLYWTTLFTSGTFDVTVKTNSVSMKNVPWGILPEECVLALLKMSGETGSTTTLDAQWQISHDDSTFFDFSTDETQMTAADTDGIHYVPDSGFLARFFRFDLVFGGATSFDDFEMYAIVASQVGERAVGLSTRVSGLGAT
jgi:hypothetical protein